MDTDTSRLFGANAANDRGQFIESLDQLSDEDFWRAAQSLAVQEPPLAATREYLECDLSRQRCLLPLDALSEVCLSPRQYACLPALPWWARGLAAWHGEVICVVDLDAYLSTRATPLDRKEQIGRDQSSPLGMLLITLHHAIPIGLHVRAIGQTRAVEPGAVAATGTASCPAAWIDPARAALVAGTLDDAVILDLPALLTDVMGAINGTSTPGRERITSHYPSPRRVAERLSPPERLSAPTPGRDESAPTP